jgi:cyanophycinase-like exopeptidase
MKGMGDIAVRILAIMGSGETAPTMAKVHRALFERLGPGHVPAAIIDTPYGFQENADELSARTVEFFSTSVGRPVSVASLRSRDVDAITAATAVARVREARYVMAGAGSPSYALRQWTGGPIPEALLSKLASGGVLAMASAAALTLGVVTIPVYEVYKVGEPPRWLDGLDLLGLTTGLRAAVVPHYDNAEGGTHDTRFCYMGERRLRILEAGLPAGAFILGVDGHTALLLDLEAGTASVAGLGCVTVRVDGRSTRFPAGTRVPIRVLSDAAAAVAAGEAAPEPDGPAFLSTGSPPLEGTGEPKGPRLYLRDEMAELEGSFIEALDRGDARAATEALLDLDLAIEARVRAGEDSPDLDNATAVFRALIASLGERAEAGTRDPRTSFEPFVTTLLELRARARDAGDWATADLIRDRLAAVGVQVRDDIEGPTWHLSAPRRS